MEPVPGPVLTHLLDHLRSDSSMAWLGLDGERAVAESGGALAGYGIPHLRPGEFLGEWASFLEGVLPVGDSSILLPRLQMPSGSFADVHAFEAAGRTWIVLLDCTEDTLSRQLMQQDGNELNLLRALQRQSADRGEFHRAVLSRLGLGILQREEGTLFAVLDSPRWLRDLWPTATEGARVAPAERFPFLEEFLGEADGAWSSEEATLLRSGFWVESLTGGEDIPLEAAALRVGPRQVLLLGLPISQYRREQRLLQKAREHTMAHEQLRREIQKKEVLLHCIIHDVLGPLSAIKSSAWLVAERVTDEESAALLDICLRQCSQQEALVKSILDAFAAEVGPGAAGSPSAQAWTEAGEALASAAGECGPSYRMEGVALRIDPGNPPGPLKVWIDSVSLNRMLANLVENALRHSREGSAVTLGLDLEEGFLRFRVDDEGPGVPPEKTGDLFQKFGRAGGERGKVGLGLYYCRITAEKWGGSIGQENRPEGGSRFWFRLRLSPG